MGLRSDRYTRFGQLKKLYPASVTGITFAVATLFRIAPVLTVDENNNVNLGNLISRSAKYWPERTAVIDRHTRVTFAELEQRTNQLASAFTASASSGGSQLTGLVSPRFSSVG